MIGKLNYNSSKRICQIAKSFRILMIVIVGTLLSASCSSHKNAKESDAGKENAIIAKPKHKLSGVQKKLMAEAESWLGTPYAYAHQEKGSGTDCSGFLMVVYQEVTGVKLPRNSARQAEFCKKIKEDEIVPGDLVFFATGKDPQKVSHVGMMMDQENFIHASSSKGVVVSTIKNLYFKRRYLMYGRVPQLESML